MATIATLNVLLNLDDNAFQRGIQNSRDKLDSWGKSLRSTGTMMTGFITTPIIGSGAAVVKWAADLEQTVGATEHLWGDNAGSILAWAESADQSLGMTQNEALTTANRLNGLFKMMGYDLDESEAKTKELTTRFADLSAMMGGDPVDAAEAYTSALMGNYEALDAYNVNINDAMVSQRALTMTGKDSVAQLTAEEKQLAFNALYMEKTADAHGQFGRESKTTTGRLQRLTAELKNSATTLGTMLLPYVNKALGVLAKLSAWIIGLTDAQRKWILIIAAAAAAMGPLLIILGMLLPGLGALLAVIGFLLSPIGLVVIAIAALAAGLIYAYTHFDGFRNAVDAVASAIKGGSIAALDALVESFNKLKAAFDAGGFSAMFATLGSMILNGLQNMSNLAMQGIQWLADQFIAGVATLSAAGWAWIQGLADGALGKWNEFTLWLAGLVLSASAWLGDTTGALLLKGIDLITGLWNGAALMWVNVTTWLAGIGIAAFTAVGDTLSTIKTRGWDLIQGFSQGMTEKWEVVYLWFTLMASTAFTAIGDVTTTLLSLGSSIIAGFWTGATDKWVSVRQWFINLPTMIFNAIGSLGMTLFSRGKEALSGFYMGIVDGWTIGGARGYLTSIGGKIVSAVGDLSGLLVQAGKDAIQGLVDGVASMYSSLEGKVNDIINIFNRIPGLGNSPWPMMIDAATDAMDGLMIGLQANMRPLSRQVDGVVDIFSSANPQITAGIPGEFDRSGATIHAAAPGGTVVNHNYFVTPEALKEMIEGGKFARQFGNELAMMEGLA